MIRIITDLKEISVNAIKAINACIVSLAQNLIN